MLHRFPAEIALKTISNLPLGSVYSISLVSRDWTALIALNEPTVFRNAALLHRFLDGDQRFSGVGSIIADWKAYCRRQLEIERGWRGKGPSVVQGLTSTPGPMVHRIKIDYELGFVVSTYQMGGLFVCDIKTDRVLWALLPPHVAPFVHVEYDRGYIVFSRYDNCKEVWRHSNDTGGTQHSEISPPDEKMLDISARASSRFNSTRISHGHFTAWALLRIPEEGHWFRVLYPNLLVVAADNAYVWDILTMQLVSVIRNLQQRHQDFKLGRISYAEVNDQYAFICGKGGLRIYARNGGELLYQIPSRLLRGKVWDVLPQTNEGAATSVVHPQILQHNKYYSYRIYGAFMACHVSASGKDFAILTTDGRVVLLPNFQRLLSGPETVHYQDIAIILNLQPTSNEHISRYFSSGQNGKLAVATEEGVYVISLDFDFDPLTTNSPPEPGVSVCRLSRSEHELTLSLVSCLQIMRDTVYIIYKPSQRGMPAANTVYTVCF